MRLFAALCVLLVAAGCSSSKPSVTSSPAASAVATSTPAATPCSVAGASTDDASVSSSASTAAVTDVRYSDDGCPRIVFQFAGDHTPGYKIGYAQGPFSDCGSGAAVATTSWGSDQYLQIRLSPSGGVDLSKSANPTYTGPRDITVDGKTLKHLKVTCDFEAVFTWLAGLSGKHAFKVSSMTNPPRIVVNISGATRN
jgi:hypothetical protein